MVWPILAALGTGATTAASTLPAWVTSAGTALGAGALQGITAGAASRVGGIIGGDPAAYAAPGVAAQHFATTSQTASQGQQMGYQNAALNQQYNLAMEQISSQERMQSNRHRFQAWALSQNGQPESGNWGTAWAEGLHKLGLNVRSLHDPYGIGNR